MHSVYKIDKKVITMLAILTVFSTVAPAGVFAYDTGFVVSSVQSSTHTGGLYGSDGQDGIDGQDGRPGNDGSTAINSSGNASVHIEAYSNGNKTVDIYKTQESGTDTEAVAEVFVYDIDSATTSENDTLHTQNNVASQEQMDVLAQVLSSIRLILQLYVGILF